MKYFLEKKRFLKGAIIVLANVAIALLGVTFGKYVTEIRREFDLNINAYGEIAIALCKGQDATKSWGSSEYNIIPGAKIEYNPYVLVNGGSEACYLYIEIVESIQTDKEFSDYIEYSVAEGWTQGDGIAVPSNVYYREVEYNTNDQFFGIFTDDKISIPCEVTSDMLMDLTEEPAIKLIAHAVQKAKLNDAENESAVAAWGWLMGT